MADLLFKDEDIKAFDGLIANLRTFEGIAFINLFNSVANKRQAEAQKALQEAKEALPKQAEPQQEVQEPGN